MYLDRTDRRHRRPVGRPIHQRDQTRHRREGHGRNHSGARRNPGSDRFLDLRRAAVSSHDTLLLRAIIDPVRECLSRTGLSMDQWHYDTAADLDHTVAERLKNFPREPDMLVYGCRLVAAAAL